MQHITHLLRKPVFVQYINSKSYEDSIELIDMGPQSNLILSLQVFPYGSNKKLILTQEQVIYLSDGTPIYGHTGLIA